MSVRKQIDNSINRYVTLLFESYIEEFTKLKNCNSIDYLIKSCAFYTLPWLLTYFEVFGYRTFWSMSIAMFALLLLPLVVVSGMRAYMGIMYVVMMKQSNQTTLKDYNNEPKN